MLNCQIPTNHAYRKLQSIDKNQFMYLITVVHYIAINTNKYEC